MIDRPSFLASRVMHALIVLMGGILVTVGVLQLPLSVIQNNIRGAVPFRLTRLTSQGMPIAVTRNTEGEEIPVRNGDILRRFQECPLDSAHFDYLAFLKVISRLRPGDEVALDILRDGRPLTVRLSIRSTVRQTAPLTLQLSNYLVGLVSPLVMFLIGLIVVFNRPRNRVAVLNFFILASIGFYLIMDGLIQSFVFWGIPGLTSLWYIGSLSYSLCYPLLIHFFLVFPNERLLRGSAGLRNVVVYVPYLVVFLLEVLIFGSFGVAQESQYLLAYTIYGVYALSPIVSIVLLVTSYRRATTRHLRRVLRTMLVGVGVFSVSVLVSFLLAPLMQWLDFSIDLFLVIRIVDLLCLTFSLPLAFAVAIFRYGYLEVNVLFRRAVVYVAFSLALTAVLVGCYHLLISYGRFISPTETLLLVGVITVLVTTFFSGARDRLQAGMERLLFRRERQLADAVQVLRHELLGVLSTTELRDRLLRDLPALFRLSSATAVVLHPSLPPAVITGDPCEVGALTPILTHPPMLEALERSEAVQTSAYLPGLHRAEAAVLVGLGLRAQEGLCLVFGEKVSGRSLSSREMALLQSVSEYAAMAWKNAIVTEELEDRTRLRRDMEIAHDIQASMLPQERPTIPGLDIAAFSEAAAEVGGDFHDFVRLKDGRWGVVVGDVSDKGVSAALVMASSMSVIRLAATEATSPRALLERVNRRMYEDTRPNMFVAVLAGVVDEEARTFTFSNAGLPKPMVWRDGECYLVDWSSDGDHLALGLQPSVRYHEQTIPLHVGDILLLMSDGLLETPNYDGEEFGIRRLRDVVRQHASGPATDLIAAIRAALEEHRNYQPLCDDVSLVVVRKKEISE